MATRTFATTSIFLAPAASLFLAGYSWAMTQNVMPLLYKGGSAQITTSLFKQIFYGGAYVAPPCSLGSSLMTAYLAYLCTDASQRNKYLASFATAMITAPITMLVMLPGIKRLIEISESQVEQENCEKTLEHRELLQSWSFWNGVRAACYLCSGGLSLWAGIFG